MPLTPMKTIHIFLANRCSNLKLSHSVVKIYKHKNIFRKGKQKYLSYFQLIIFYMCSEKNSFYKNIKEDYKFPLKFNLEEEMISCHILIIEEF